MTNLTTHSAFFAQERKKFHNKLIDDNILTFSVPIASNANSSSLPIASNADGSSVPSKEIAKNIADQIGGVKTVRKKKVGQSLGTGFEVACASFVKNTFVQLKHLRPGSLTVSQVPTKDLHTIADFEQYAHLKVLDELAKNNPQLAAVLGSEYLIRPDVVVHRHALTDEEINNGQSLIDGNVSTLASLRQQDSKQPPLLHASISCKWTLRSDRAQNARSEALNLVRNRKGHLPHVVVVTAEPTPGRLASIALGTGDIDCVYHFALYELQQAVRDLPKHDPKDMLNVMVQGKRLKDISDLPLDLAT